MNKIKIIISSLCVTASLWGWANTSLAEVQEVTVKEVAEQLNVEYAVVENLIGEQQCPIESPCFNIEIKLTLPFDYKEKDWTLYYSQLRKVLKVNSQDFNVEMLTGNLKKITPTETFSGFEANKAQVLRIQMHGDHMNEFKPMPNYYLTDKNNQAYIIASTVPTLDSETGLEIQPHLQSFTSEKQFRSKPEDQSQWATAERLYQVNQASVLPVTDQLARIIPKPERTEVKGGELDLARGVKVKIDGFKRKDVAEAFNRLKLIGVSENTKGVDLLIVKKPEKYSDEGYSLDIQDKQILIEASHERGAFYGLQSLAALVDVDSTFIPKVVVTDQPRYPFRGLHIDVSRNFRDKQFVLDMLEQMAAYKLNKLHLHLSDDEGWRVEIPGLPELTEIGAYRCHDPDENKCIFPQFGSGPYRDSHANGFYSTQDYIDILKEAKKRYIEVIPSFDMPGHSRAAVRSMDARYRKYMAKGDEKKAMQYLLVDPDDKTKYMSIQGYTDNTMNVCVDSSYAFVDKVLHELQIMHEKAKHPLNIYHIGADETPGAWLDSPACKTYMAENGIDKASNLGNHFVERVSNSLAEKGILPAGWSDGLSHTHFDKMPKRVQSNMWDMLQWGQISKTHEQINNGWDVVLSLPDIAYLDMPYEADPKERGYDWAARELNSQKIFQFMPGNLPVHAEIWKGNVQQPIELKDEIPIEPGKGVKGVQGQLWSETVRSNEQAEYMLFPRIITLAERMWHKPEWEVPYSHKKQTYNSETNNISAKNKADMKQDWSEFAEVLGRRELAKLDLHGIAYRVPTVGAVIDDGILRANLIYPGLLIEYQQDGGQWKSLVGDQAVNENAVIKIRARSADGKRAGRALEVK